MYKALRAILFLFDPEKVHHVSMNGLKMLCRVGWIKKTIEKKFRPEGNTQYSILNIQFPNRVGLGAGFDKNAKYLKELAAIGFGFVEIGTVTPLPQRGNAAPRLFRLPKDKALINRMGFNNDGVKVISERLRKWREQSAITGYGLRVESPELNNPEPITRNLRLIIGGNIGKNKDTPNESAWKDYEICFSTLQEYVDYFAVNVSSPNTPGLRELQEKDSLKKILSNLQTLNVNLETPKPIFLKIAPDLSAEQVDDVVDLALEINLEGLIISNTTTGRQYLKTTSEVIEKTGTGGLSGLPLKNRSTEIIRYIHNKTKNIRIIASGGIFNAEDAKEKLDAGASLLQVWTGFIYEGPVIVKNICKGI